MVDQRIQKAKDKRTKAPAASASPVGNIEGSPPPGSQSAVEVSLQSMMLLMKLIEDQEHVVPFLTSAKIAAMKITMDAASVDFVKQYVAANSLREKVPTSAMSLLPPIIEFAARTSEGRVVDPIPDDPFEWFRR